MLGSLSSLLLSYFLSPLILGFNFLITDLLVSPLMRNFPDLELAILARSKHDILLFVVVDHLYLVSEVSL